MNETNEMYGLIAFYGTENLAATKRFYGDWLGFPVLLDQGSCLLFGVPGGGSFPDPAEREIPANPHRSVLWPRGFPCRIKVIRSAVSFAKNLPAALNRRFI